MHTIKKKKLNTLAKEKRMNGGKCQRSSNSNRIQSIYELN